MAAHNGWDALSLKSLEDHFGLSTHDVLIASTLRRLGGRGEAERLAFFGDSVLAYFVALELRSNEVDHDEQQLTEGGLTLHKQLYVSNYVLAMFLQQGLGVVAPLLSNLNEHDWGTI